jgi:hypothetical protein
MVDRQILLLFIRTIFCYIFLICVEYVWSFWAWARRTELGLVVSKSRIFFKRHDLYLNRPNPTWWNFQKIRSLVWTPYLHCRDQGRASEQIFKIGSVPGRDFLLESHVTWVSRWLTSVGFRINAVTSERFL